VCALVGMHKFLRLLLSYQIIYLRRERPHPSRFAHFRTFPAPALALLVLFACCRKISICVPPTSMVDGRSFNIFRYLQALCPFSFGPALICRRHRQHTQPTERLCEICECISNVVQMFSFFTALPPLASIWPFEYEFISMCLGLAAYTQFM